MLHRIFVAINLPQALKEELALLSSTYPELPARWTKRENLHITLHFMGNASDEDIVRIKEKLGPVAESRKSFGLTTAGISYGPSEKNPRMLWMLIKNSEELTNLYSDISSGLSALGFSSERETFMPHITLAKINQLRFRAIEPEERSEVQEELELNFQVSSFELAESRPRPGSSEYHSLHSFCLQ